MFAKVFYEKFAKCLMLCDLETVVVVELKAAETKTLGDQDR